MQAKDLKPAGSLAQRFGVKSVIFGPPGTGKTPLVNTAPRPVLLACEPGLLSMRGSQVPTFDAYTSARINEFWSWFFTSTETKNYDTIAVDSVSHMCQVYLDDALKRIKHGMQAYGDMATKVMGILNQLYFMERKHTYLICKQEFINIDGFNVRRPYFPGKQLPVDVPHMFDEILHLCKAPIPGVGEQLAFRCQGSIDTIARDRTGRLDEFEPPNFSLIVKKCMS